MAAKQASHEGAPRVRAKKGAEADRDPAYKYVWAEELRGSLEEFDSGHGPEHYIEDLDYEVVPGYEEKRRKLLRVPIAVYNKRQKEVETIANERVRRRNAVSATGITDKITAGKPVKVQDLADIEPPALGENEFDPLAGKVDTNADPVLNG